jgi:hypothetical protein
MTLRAQAGLPQRWRARAWRRWNSRKLEVYQRRYEKYIKTAKALAALMEINDTDGFVILPVYSGIPGPSQNCTRPLSQRAAKDL